MHDTQLREISSRCLACEHLGNLPGAAGYCKRLTPLTALLACELLNCRPVFCPFNSEKPRALPVNALPDRCSECENCEAITDRMYLCTRMNPRILLLPREVHHTRPVFCPRLPEYRQAQT